MELQVAYADRNWFELHDELQGLPKAQRIQVLGRIARDIGQRAGVAPLGYAMALIIFTVASQQIRDQMHWLWLPSASLLLCGLMEYFTARALAMSMDEECELPKHTYQVLSRMSALSWGMFVGLSLLLLQENLLSMLLFLWTVAATSIAVGTQTQEKEQWLQYLAMTWTPIAASAAFMAGINHQMEGLLLSVIAVVFPVLVGVQGLRLVAEYLEAQLDQASLESRTDQLEQALIRQQLAEKERNQMEVQLRHAQKLEAIGQLAAGIAHEINTPVQFVGDNTSFLQEAFEDMVQMHQRERELIAALPENSDLSRKVQALEEQYDLEFLLQEVPRSLEQSKEGLSRIAKIVLAMKEFSHPGSNEKQPVDINQVIRTTVEISRNEWKYSAEVECSLEEQLPTVPGYAQELNQVLLNMIVNASHAIDERYGRQPGTRGHIRILTRDMNKRVQIQITDDGIGMPESITNKIFDPFFTTKAVGKGSGQGLAISYSVIVDKHAGAINVESKPGVGTTFTITLPKDAGNCDGKHKE